MDTETKTNYLLFLIISLFILAFIILIADSVILRYNLPIHRLKKYRIIRKHEVFECLGEMHQYYKYYIQEKYFLFWKDIEDSKIPYRSDKELDNNKQQRQDNYFDKLESAQKCKNDLIKKRETDYKIRKIKEKDKVFK